MTKTDCLTRSQILRFVGQQARPEERRRIGRHAADCDACRGELVSAWRDHGDAVEPTPVPADLRSRVDQLVPLRPSSRVNWLRPRFLVPLAALLLMALVVSRSGIRFGPESAKTPILRGQNGEALEVLSPADGAVVEARANKVDFAWRVGSGTAKYQLVILDGAGDRVYEVEARTGSWSIATADLGPGDFYWTVSELRADGSSLTVGQRHLQILK